MGNTSFEAENMTRGTAQHKGFTNFEIFSSCILLFITVVGLIGNGLVIFLTGCRMKTSVNSIWFFNLAVADFIFMLSSIINLLSSLALGHLYLTNAILVIVLTLNQFASVFFLVVISLDRCLCTWMVVWAQNKRTLLRARIICMIVWVSSIGCTIPFFNVYMFTMFTPTFKVTFEFIVGFLIPFLIIAFSYTAIGVRITLFKRGKHLRSYRVIITVLLAFFICWFPYHAVNFCKITANKQSASDSIQIAWTVSIYLVNLNSCLNPILYVFMCDEYKKKLKQSLLLVLETAFAEDHLDFKADAKGREGQENQIEFLDM